MPKIRTRSSVKKRFKITASGKLRRKRASMSHNKAKKKAKRIRQGRLSLEVSKADQGQILNLFGK